MLKPLLLVLTGCVVMVACGGDQAGGGDGEKCHPDGSCDPGLVCLSGICREFESICGNDKREGDEVCDGTDVGGQDCISRGFTGGVLGCTIDCTAVDTSGCTGGDCGNDLKRGDEICDGTDLDGEDCVTQGFSSGSLACVEDCSAFDLSGCCLSCAGWTSRCASDECPDPGLVCPEAPQAAFDALLECICAGCTDSCVLRCTGEGADQPDCQDCWTTATSATCLAQLQECQDN